MEETRDGGSLVLSRRTGERVIITCRKTGEQLIVMPTYTDSHKVRLLFDGPAFEVNREEIQIAKDAARKPD